MSLLIRILILMAVLLPAQAFSANTTVRLILSHQEAKPGETIVAGLEMKMKPGWHTYWRNPGDSGQETKIAWTLPAGVAVDPIQWPLPGKLEEEGLVTYIYKETVMLLIPVRLGKDVAPGALILKGKASWLECEKSCIPGSGMFEASLTVGNVSKISSDAAQISEWTGKLPASDRLLEIPFSYDGPEKDEQKPVKLVWKAGPEVESWDFFPYTHKGFEVGGLSSNPIAGDLSILAKSIRKIDGDWPATFNGVIVSILRSGGTEAREATAKLSAASASVGPGQVSTSTSAPVTLWKAIFTGFLGGLILNIMPCVLPVIALKILGFINQAQNRKSEIRKLGMVYTAGVLVSFLVLAGLVIGVKSVGGAASWGMQLQNPQVVLVLTMLVTLVALNLFGVFEINLGGTAMSAAGDLSAREGPGGAFFNGVLATVLATPCTAPFLAPALGFAFVQPSATILLVFLSVGFGLALPYLLLSWEPAWLKFLPKPGVWMLKFKVAMGFPMLATAIWLFDNATEFFPENGTLWIGLLLLTVGAAAWVYGEFFQRGRSRKAWGLITVIALVLFSYFFILEKNLEWRHPPKLVQGKVSALPGGIDWRPWSPAAVETARKEGRPVFVDFTAKWCLTCQLNKKTSIEIDAVREKLKEINAVALIENSPVKSEEVVRELNKHGRAGVPLVLVYPKDGSKPPMVLPEILTKTIVLEALRKAAE